MLCFSSVLPFYFVVRRLAPSSSLPKILQKKEFAGMLCEGRFALYLAGEPYKSGLKAQGCGKLKKAVFSIELDEDEEAE